MEVFSKLYSENWWRKRYLSYIVYFNIDKLVIIRDEKSVVFFSYL